MIRPGPGGRERGNRMASKHLDRILVGACIAAAAFATPALAQDSTQAQAAARPQRHVVQAGETLWGLAGLYLGDPFLWPEIYRINTSVVEDPHWIFPGEELMLVPADHTQVAVEPEAGPEPVVTPPADSLAVADQAAARPVEAVEMPEALPAAPPPAAETGPTIFRRVAVEQEAMPVQVGPSDKFRGVRPGDFYRSGFLTEGDVLPFGNVVAIADLGTARGARQGSEAAMAMFLQELNIRAPAGASYQVGDSLLTVMLEREVQGWGRIVMPTGIVRVVSVNGRDAVAQIIEQFHAVRAGQHLLPVEPFPRSAGGPPQRVAGGIEGLLVARQRENPVPGQHDVLFIDLGRNVGLTLGDRFEILATQEIRDFSPAGPQVIGEVEVVHVRERSATVILREIFTPGIRTASGNASGVPVRLIAKMPA